MKAIMIVTCLCISISAFMLYIFINHSSSQKYIPAEYVVIVDQITADVAAKLANRYNMRVIGIGGGLAGGVNRLGLSFQIRGPLSKEQLRAIVVDCVEEFLLPINTNERLRPSLKNYPFTANEIEIKIFIVDKSGRRVHDPEIMIAKEFQGTVEYLTVDKDAKFGYKSSTEEDYEEALKIVRDGFKN